MWLERLIRPAWWGWHGPDNGKLPEPVYGSRRESSGDPRPQGSSWKTQPRWLRRRGSPVSWPRPLAARSRATSSWSRGAVYSRRARRLRRSGGRPADAERVRPARAPRAPPSPPRAGRGPRPRPQLRRRLAGRSRRRTCRLPVVRQPSRHHRHSRRRGLVYRLADRVITSGQAAARMVTTTARTRRAHRADRARRGHGPVSSRRVRTSRAHRAGAGRSAAGRPHGQHPWLQGSRSAGRRPAPCSPASPAARFLIVGDDVRFADVNVRVQALGLDPAVSMTGFRRDIPQVMAALDVLVLPSIRSEAASQVIPQALAVGTPVVAGDIGSSSSRSRRRDRPPRARRDARRWPRRSSTA